VKADDKASADADDSSDADESSDDSFCADESGDGSLMQNINITIPFLPVF
jgi:hypothetical protein